MIVLLSEHQPARLYELPHSRTQTVLVRRIGRALRKGDTLVVDTIGQNTKARRHYRTPHTDKLHVRERWR
jgi:hypothetical protein